MLVVKFRHQRYALISRSGDSSHDAHEFPVVCGFIPAHEDRFVESFARLSDSLQFWLKLVKGDFSLLDENLALGIDRERERLAIGLQRGALAFRQIHRHASGQERRGHHKDDEKHQHHVDERRDVDLRHGPMPPDSAFVFRHPCCLRQPEAMRP